MKFSKVLAWLLILGIIGYVSFSVYTGKSEDATANVVLNPRGEPAKVLGTPECIDTDDGKNYFQLGHTYNTEDDLMYDDYCEGDVLVEYFCNNAYPDRISIPCNCFKGACIE